MGCCRAGAVGLCPPSVAMRAKATRLGHKRSGDGGHCILVDTGPNRSDLSTILSSYGWAVTSVTSPPSPGLRHALTGYSNTPSPYCALSKSPRQLTISCASGLPAVNWGAPPRSHLCTHDTCCAYKTTNADTRLRNHRVGSERGSPNGRHIQIVRPRL